MVGKNNTQERFRRNATKDKRYTLKKLSVGLASVALGTVLFLNGAETVSAEAEVVDPNTPAAQPVQETFQFNYLNQATGARLDGFFGDYVNANEAEKAFRHYANEQGYTLLNVRLEGHTFTADVAVEQGVQPEVEQEAQPAESTFQFIYRDKETGEKFDSFFGDYVNENEAEKDFRHYANQHGYTLLNVRLEGHTFTADVAVEQEAQPAESAFQFIYRDKETGEKFDSFFGDYANENEAEKDFRHYANQHGYTLLNVRQNGHTFTADVARDSQSEETPEVEKGYSYALNFDGRTESANLGEFDSEEQAELALRIFANEQGYELSNLRLEGRTFHADAKVAAEADEPSESTDRYLQEAKDRARGIINGLENLFDTQKPSYLERIEDADSVAAVEAIVEEAQNYVNEGKGGENGQATEEPEKPEYNPEENLVTYDLQITDQNGRTQTQKVTFPSRELALNYISQLVRSYEKAGVVLNEERSDVEGKDNTFILVFEEKQAEEPAKADYTVKVIVDGEERQSQALPDTTRQGAIDYAERLAKSYEQDGFTYNHLDAGLPSDTVIRIELSSPELDVPSHTEDAPAPEALDVTKAEALDIIAGLDLDDVIKDNLVYEINQAEDEATVGQVIAKAYKIVAAGLAEEPTPELDSEEEAGRELDAAKAEALDAIAGLEHLSEEEKAGFVDRINETTELGEVNRLVGLAFKRNIENFPAPTPELDPEEEAGRELDAAKAEALDAIAGLEHLSEEEKADFVDRINETTELGEVNRLVGLAFKRNIENFPESTPELDPEEEAGRELDVAKAEALDAIAGLEYLSEEEKADFVDRINETTELGEVNRLVGLAFKRNIENFPAPTPELDPEEEAGRELDAAKVGALEDIANLDYFTADEKQDLVDRINDYDNTGDIDFIVSKAIEENDARHKAAEALKAHKEKAIKDLKAKGFDNDFVFGLIDKANTKEGVDALVEELNAKPEAEFDLDAYKELVKNELKAKGFDNDFVFGLIDKANTKEGVDALVEELNAKPEAEFDLNAYKELVKNELKAKGFDNGFVFGLIDKANTKEGVDALVEELNAKPEAEFDLGAYKELVKNELKAKGFDNDFVFGLIDKANTKEGVDALVEELNAKPEAEFDLGAYKELVKNELKAKGFDNDFVFGLIDKANTKEGVDALVEELNAKPEAEFDLDAYKELVKNELKAKGFDNDFVFGLIDKATNKEGVDALVANIDLDELNKLNNEFGQLEQKAEDLNNELEALINKVEGKEEVAQEDLDAILNKVNEIRENLDKMQKHINILSSEERENAQAELDQVKELLDKVEEQYSYSFDLDAYKEEVKDSLKAQGFDNKFVFELIDKATNKEGVDALVANIDLDELNKLNNEFGQLEQKAEDLNNELEALINKVEGKEEVAQEDLDAILNKVNEIRENLDKMQKHINILPSEERENAQAELDQVKELLDKVEEQYSYSFDLDAYKEEAAEIVDKLDNLSDEGKAVIKDEINQATTTEEVDRLVDEAKGISSDNDEFDASRLEGHKESATKVVDQFVEEALLSEEQAGNFKKAIENAEDLDTVDSVVEAVLKQVFDNQKAAAVQDVEDDINLSESLKEKYVPLLEGAETPEQLDEILLNLDKEEAAEIVDKLDNLSDEGKAVIKDEINQATTTEEVDRLVDEAKGISSDNDEFDASRLEGHKESATKVVDQFVEEALLSEEQAGNFKKAIENAEDLDTVDSVVEAVLKQVFDNQKAAAVQDVEDDINLSESLKEKYVPLLEGAETPEQLDEILLNLDKEEAAEIVDKLDNLSDEGKAVIKDEINQATTTEEVDRLVDEAKGISSDNDEFDASRLEGHKEGATKVVDQFVEEALLSEEQAGNFKKAIENAEDLDTVDSVVEAVLKQVFDNQKATVVQSVKDDINLSETLKGKYVPKLEAAETAEELDKLLLELDKDEVRELIDEAVANNYLAASDAEIHKHNLDVSEDSDKVEEVKNNVLAGIFKNQKEEVVRNVKADDTLSETLKGKYVPKLEAAETAEELDKLLLELDKDEVRELIDEAVANNYLAASDAEIHKHNLDVSEDSDKVEEVKNNVLAGIFKNQKEEVVRNVKADDTLSETLKEKYVPKLEAAETAEELDKLLLELDKDEVRELIDEAVANNYLAASDAEIHKHNLDVSEDSDKVEEVKNNVLAGIFKNQKEEVVRNVKTDDTLSNTLKEKYVPQLEAAETAEELDKLLLELDKDEVRELIDEAVANNYLAASDAEVHKHNLDVSEDSDKVEEVKNNVLAGIFKNQKEEVVRNVKTDDTLSDTLKEKYVPQLEAAETAEELDKLLLELDKDEVRELIDEAVANNYLAASDAEVHKHNLDVSEDSDKVEEVKNNVLAGIFKNQKEEVVRNVKTDDTLSNTLKEKYVPQLEAAETAEELDKLLLELDKDEVRELIDEAVANNYLAASDAEVHKHNLDVSEDSDKVEEVKNNVLAGIFKNQKEEVVRNVKTDDTLSDTLKEKYVPQLEAAETAEELDKLLLELDKDEVRELIDEAVANNYLAASDAEVHKHNLDVSEDSDKVEEVKNNVLAGIFKNQKEEVVRNVKTDDTLSDTLKGKYVPKLEAAETAEELDKLLLELDKDEVRELIDEAVANNYLAASDAEVHKHNLDVSEDSDKVEEVKNNVLAGIFKNQKEEVVRNVKTDDTLSDTLKGKYVPKLEAAQTGSELDKVLKTLDTEEAVEKAEKAAENAKNELNKAAGHEEISATDQGHIIAANNMVKEDKKKAQELLDELSSQYAEELGSDQELKERLDDLQERLNNVSEVDVPEISEETLEKFKEDAIEKLKQLARNLEATEQKVYEDIIRKMNATDNSENNINEIVQVAIAEDQFKQVEKEQNQDEKDKLKRRAQGALNFVEGTSEDAEDYPEYKQDLLKEKKRIQDLLDGETTPTPPTDDAGEGDTDDQTPDEDNGQAVARAEQAVKEAEDKAKEAANFLEKAAEDKQITENELETARDNNADIAELKEKAQAEINKLPENVQKDLQDRLNKVKSPGLPPVTPSSKAESANLTIDGASILGEKRQQDYRDKVEEADKLENSEEKIDDILKALVAEIAVKRAEDKAEQAVKEAENKAKEAANFLKEAANDEDGITEQDLEQALQNNKDIEQLKAAAQEKLDKLSNSQQEVKTNLQDRLDNVKEIALPPVSPSSKAELANRYIEESPLEEQRKEVYREKVKEADQLDDSDNKIDDILAAHAAEVEVKKAEDKEAVAESLVKEAVAEGGVTDEEQKAIDAANEVVRNLKADAQKSVSGLSDSVSDLRKHLQDRLNNVDEAKIPGGDTEQQPGSPDTGSDQDAGDQTPGQGGGDSTEDSSTEGGSSESSDDQSDEPDENSELKDKQKAATEALDELSHLDEKQKEDYQKNIAEAQDEGTVEYIVDKAQLENIKKLNTASKKDKDADERKEVTVEDQEEAKRNIEEIKGRLNDPNNNLTQEQKKELKKLLGEIEVPRTHHYLPQIGNAVQEFLSTGMLTNKAAHARVGWQANGQDNGNGIVWNKEVNFSSGDDILEVREGVGQNARINLGAGNDEFIIHGTMPGVAYAFRRTGELTYVDGGTGKDKAIMKSKSKQILQIQYIRNFNEVVMDGTDGELQITKENLEKSLGKEKVLKVRKGANGKNNTVKLYGMAPEGRGDIVRDKETGINYRKWKYKGLDKEIWIEATRDLKTEF